MRTTQIPAQITDIEDKITSNISLNQLLIFIFSLLFVAVIFIGIPPFISISNPKIWLSGVIITFSLALAIRVNGQIVLKWLILLSAYRLRARFYVFDKSGKYKHPINKGLNKSPETEKILSRVSHRKIITKGYPFVVTINPHHRIRARINKKGRLEIHVVQNQ